MKFFVITAHRLDQLYLEKRSIVEQLAATCGLEAQYAVFRVPMLHGGFHLLQTQALIRAADFIIADLSYERPSCYYEVGFAQGLGKPVHHIMFESSYGEYIPPAEVLDMEKARVYRDLATYETIVKEILQAHLLLPNNEGV